MKTGTLFLGDSGESSNIPKVSRNSVLYGDSCNREVCSIINQLPTCQSMFSLIGNRKVNGDPYPHATPTF